MIQKFEFIKTDLGENVHPNAVKMEMILEDIINIDVTNIYCRKGCPRLA